MQPSRRWALAAAVLAVIAAVLVGACAARYALHGPVTARSLYLSVRDATPSLDPLDRSTAACAPEREPRAWTCTVTDAEGSGAAVYRVRVRRSSSCWDARRIKRGIGMPERVSGSILSRERESLVMISPN